jgi:hypothetical protein
MRDSAGAGGLRTFAPSERAKQRPQRRAISALSFAPFFAYIALFSALVTLICLNGLAITGSGPGKDDLDLAGAQRTLFVDALVLPDPEERVLASVAGQDSAAVARHGKTVSKKRLRKRQDDEDDEDGEEDSGDDEAGEDSADDDSGDAEDGDEAGGDEDDAEEEEEPPPKKSAGKKGAGTPTKQKLHKDLKDVTAKSANMLKEVKAIEKELAKVKKGLKGAKVGSDEDSEEGDTEEDSEEQESDSDEEESGSDEEEGGEEDAEESEDEEEGAEEGEEGSEEEETELVAPEPKIIDPLRGSNLALAHLLDMEIDAVRAIVKEGASGGAQIAFCPTAGTSLAGLTGDERASVASACASVLNDNDVNVIVQGAVIVLQVGFKTRWTSHFARLDLSNILCPTRTPPLSNTCLNSDSLPTSLLQSNAHFLQFAA